MVPSDVHDVHDETPVMEPQPRRVQRGGRGRGWVARQADVLVSELLGSFGDNELSPECLDGAQRFLAPGGVSVPAAYTSQLQPIAASRAWADVKASAPAARPAQAPTLPHPCAAPAAEPAWSPRSSLLQHTRGCH